MDNSNEPLLAARLRKTFLAVGAATMALIALEIFTWVINAGALSWSTRIFRISFELCLAAILSVIILKKERYFLPNLRNGAKPHDFKEEQMRLAMDAAKIGYWNWDVLTDEQVWSVTCKALLGLPPESAANFDVLIKSVHPDDRTKLWSAINHAIEEKKEYSCEFRVVWPDGSMHWQAARGRVSHDDTGRITRMIGIAIDIDDQKATETRLRLHTAALEAAANAIVITDSTGSILWVNQAFTDLTGYGREESVGQNPRMLKSWEHGHSFYDNLWSTIKSGHVWRGEVRNRKKDGSVYTEDMTITPLCSPSGEITQFIAIKQDATEKKKLEAQYRQAQKMGAVGRLACGVAHDFHNILGVITGYCEISLEKLDPEQTVATHLRKIKAAANRAASLTKQLLTFSRQQVVYPRIIDLNTIVRNMEEMMRRLVGDDVSISVKETTPLWCMKADVGQVEQILMNLAVNARDAMPEGGQITIETRNVELDEGYRRKHEPVQPGRYVMLCISDTGSGMDETTKARIFEPFYTTKSAGKGTGLGLATVYGIVEQNGGSILVNTAVGKGSTFKIYLPRIAEVAETPAVTTAPAKPVRASGTILLVEDEMGLRSVIDESLRQWGYRVLLASNGMEALEVAAEHKGPIQLLITDVIMPFISGPQLAQSLKPLRPEIRVLYISGYTADKFADYPELDPHLALLQKPFKLVDLAQKVRDLLNESRESVSANQSTIQP